MGKSRLTLKYGDRKTAVTVNERNLIQVIQPNEIEAGDEESEIIRAMQHPIETPTLNEIVLARIFALRSRFGRCSAHDTEKYGPDARITVMPYGALTLPRFQ